MASEKNIHKREYIRVVVFGVLTLFFVGLSIFGLIRNSTTAKEKYDVLIAVDQSGGDVEQALNDLRSYIYSHMNTQIGSELGINPPIQLKGTYDRLVAAEEAKLQQGNEALYAQAQEECERSQSQGFSGRNRLECIESFIDANGVDVEDAVFIEDSLYKFDFVPPKWSPDLAGFSILFAIISALGFLISLFLYSRTKHMIHMAN